MKKIGLIGAFDRDNYGDILFPIIVENAINSFTGEYSFYYFSLINADLKGIGGLTTHSIDEMYGMDLDAIIVVGGEIINADWIAMHLNLIESTRKQYIYRAAYKVFGRKFGNNFSRRKLNGNSRFPWIIDRSLVGNTRIIYKSVGGNKFTNKSKNDLEYIGKQLNSADYISVRDNSSKENIERINVKNVVVSPDSAIIMSWYFNKDNFEKYLSSNFKNNIKDYTNKNYICFQIGNYFAAGYKEIIAKELIDISNRYEKEIILLPLGIDSEHDDLVALEKIYNLIQGKTKVENIRNRNIYDIMFIISNADLFIGTSLQGNITALSYGIRTIGLDSRVNKLSSFLKTFSVSTQLFGVDYDNMSEAVEKTFNISVPELKENTINLQNKVFDNFKKIYQTIEGMY